MATSLNSSTLSPPPPTTITGPNCGAIRGAAAARLLDEYVLLDRSIRPSTSGCSPFQVSGPASSTTDLPLRADGERRAFAPENPDPGAVLEGSIALTWAHGDYFSTFGIPLIRGRNFTREEQMANRLVVIVSKNLADRFWPGQDPIGKRLKWGLNASSPAPWQTVVGIAGDVVDGPLGSEPVIHVYSPFSETADAGLASPIGGGLWRRHEHRGQRRR